MSNQKIENLLANITANIDQYTYVQIANMLQDLTVEELDELEDISIFCSSPKVTDKIQKANRFIKAKMGNSQQTIETPVEQPKVDPINNIMSKLDNIPVDQLVQIKEHLESKTQLTKLESNFIAILNTKINEINGKAM